MALLYVTLVSFFLYISHLGAEQLTNTVYRYRNGTFLRISLYKAGHGPDGVLTCFHKFLEVSDTVLFTFLLGSGLALAFVAYLLQKHGAEGMDTSAEGTDTGTDTGTDAEGTDTDTGDEVKYEGQYFQELEALPEKELSPEELAVISEHVLMEETPKGVVYMSYNAEMQTFDYYTDKFVDITYEILDTVARLFAITFLCKQVCVNYKEEQRKGEQNMLSEIEFDKLKKELDERNIINNYNKERSVFAAFKTYNKKNGNNVEKKYYIVTEKANRFKYKGKINDYEKAQKKAAAAADAEGKPNGINISYSEFKRRQQVPVQAQEQVPVQAQEQVPVQAQEQVPVQAQEQVPVPVQAQAQV